MVIYSRTILLSLLVSGTETSLFDHEDAQFTRLRVKSVSIHLFANDVGAGADISAWVLRGRGDGSSMTTRAIAYAKVEVPAAAMIAQAQYNQTFPLDLLLNPGETITVMSLYNAADGHVNVVVEVVDPPEPKEPTVTDLAAVAPIMKQQQKQPWTIWDLIGGLARV